MKKVPITFQARLQPEIVVVRVRGGGGEDAWLSISTIFHSLFPQTSLCCLQEPPLPLGPTPPHDVKFPLHYFALCFCRQPEISDRVGGGKLTGGGKNLLDGKK